TFQTGGGVYVNKDLDPGPIAAFAHVSWGATQEASRARRPACYFTNSPPPPDSFNPPTPNGGWGGPEDSSRAGDGGEEERISVLGGPLFQPDDLPFHGTLVPRDFWKVVAYVEEDALKAKGFILTQKDLEGKLEGLALDEYRLYQHRVDELAGK